MKRIDKNKQHLKKILAKVEPSGYSNNFMDSQQKKSQTIIICKQCGSTFSCGHDAVNGHCWCHDLPNVMPLTEEAKSSEDCYCPKCLEERISKNQL